jgi:hypothetical protein
MHSFGLLKFLFHDNVKRECCEMLVSSKTSPNLILNGNMKEISKKKISRYVVIKHLNTYQNWNWVVMRREVKPPPPLFYQLVHVRTFNDDISVFVCYIFFTVVRHYLVPGVEKSWCPLLKDPVTDELDDPHGHVEDADHLPQRHPTFWEQLLTLQIAVLESHQNLISVRPPGFLDGLRR